MPAAGGAHRASEARVSRCAGGVGRDWETGRWARVSRCAGCARVPATLGDLAHRSPREGSTLLTGVYSVVKERSVRAERPPSSGIVHRSGVRVKLISADCRMVCSRDVRPVTCEVANTDGHDERKALLARPEIRSLTPFALSALGESTRRS